MIDLIEFLVVCAVTAVMAALLICVQLAPFCLMGWVLYLLISRSV